MIHDKMDLPLSLCLCLKDIELLYLVIGESLYYRILYGCVVSLALLFKSVRNSRVLVLLQDFSEFSIAQISNNKIKKYQVL